MCFPTVIRQAGGQLHFVQQERLVLQCWTMIWATCVVVEGIDETR